MHPQQEALAIAVGMVESGKLPSMLDANVQAIRMEGVRIIRGKVPAEVRRALFAAVKAGQLGRLVKDGLMPEAFFHPNAKAKAVSMRNEIAYSSINSIRKCLAINTMGLEND